MHEPDLGGHVAQTLDGGPTRAGAPVPGPTPAWVWAVPTALVLTLTLPGIGRPVLWQDELATLSAVDRGLPDLVRLTTHRDAVLGVYYALVHVWTTVAGTSPAALRAPSALFVAVGVALTALIGARLAGPRAGLLAGLVLALLPTTSRYAQEARPAGLTLACAAVSTLLLLRALSAAGTGGGRRPWVLYGVSIVLLGFGQLTALSLLTGHALIVLVRGRTALRTWTLTSALAAAPLLPVVAVGYRQRFQVRWIPPTDWAHLSRVPATLAQHPLAAWTVGVAFLLTVAWSLVRGGPPRGAVLTGVAVGAVPASALIAVSFVTPLLVDRYFVFCLIGIALVLGALAVPGGRWGTALLAVLLVAAVVPGQVAVRTQTRYGQPDYRALAAVLVAQDRSGDAIVMPGERGRRFRIGLTAYTPRAKFPHDVLAVRSAAAAGSLDATECAGGTCLGHPPRLWVACWGGCTDPLGGLPRAVADRIRAGGYHQEQTWSVPGAGLALFLPAPS